VFLAPTDRPKDLQFFSRHRRAELAIDVFTGVTSLDQIPLVTVRRLADLRLRWRPCPVGGGGAEIIGGDRVPDRIGCVHARGGSYGGASAAGKTGSTRPTRTCHGYRRGARCHHATDADAICISQPEVGEAIIRNRRIPGNELRMRDGEGGFHGIASIPGLDGVPLVAGRSGAWLYGA